MGNSTRIRRVVGMAIAAALLLLVSLAAPASAQDNSGPGRNGNQSVAARLGGFTGILNFLENAAVPALLADEEIAPFFAHLTEAPDQIEQCFALMLDHDLGGSSPHFGAIVKTADARFPQEHQCRSSMSNIHRGLNIPDRIVDKFILIVATEASKAGVAESDIAEVGKVLNRYRGGVRNK